MLSGTLILCSNASCVLGVTVHTVNTSKVFFIVSDLQYKNISCGFKYNMF